MRPVKALADYERDVLDSHAIESREADQSDPKQYAIQLRLWRRGYLEFRNGWFSITPVGFKMLGKFE